MWWSIGTVLMQLVLGTVVFIGGPALLIAVAMDVRQEFGGERDGRYSDL